MENVSYALGLSIGNNFRASGIKELKMDDFLKGLKDVFSEAEPAIGYDEAKQILHDFFMKLQAERHEINKQAGAEFLRINKEKAGVVTLPSGLQYEVLKTGDGTKPKASDKVKCHYHGTLINGTVFDSSVQRGEPATFPLNQVIAGWTEGLQLMKEGAKYRFFIPYTLGYGERGAGSSIPPFAALIFDVELIKVL